jgi:S-formylglutathione hydrolase FrmB
MTFSPSARPSRRALLAGSAAAAGTLAAPVAAHAAVSDPYDRSQYEPSHGLAFAGGWPVAIPDWRSIDFRVHAPKIRTFPPSFRVTLPAGYTDDPDRRYPVLLLLHGQGGNYTQWTAHDTGEDGGDGGGGGDALSRAADEDVILVMPDGGAGSFYSNANAPGPGREAAWETFIIEQVLPFVHANFRTDPARMAVAGLSMGGWGALALGQKYQDLFTSISSYSGPADCRLGERDGFLVAATIWLCPAFDLFTYPATSNGPGATWGPALDPSIASTYDPIENIERYRGKRVFLRNGDGNWIDFVEALKGHRDLLDQLRRKVDTFGGDILEGTVNPNLERFSNALTDAGIDNDYRMDKGRTHDWGLWRENFAEDLPGIMAALTA